MKTIFKLLLAIISLTYASLNACELKEDAISLEEMVLSSPTLVRTIVNDKVYLNMDKVEYAEDGLAIMLDNAIIFHVPYICIDSHGAFINVETIRGKYCWQCDECGYTWLGGVHQWFCPNKGCRNIRRVDW